MPEQRDWLRRDLALVKDKTAPVVVAMHAATYRYNKFNDKVTPNLSEPEYSAELKACFDGFEDVHFVSGHIHKNLLARVDDHLIEHNVGAVSGSWWRTGHYHYQMLGPDAGPCGYEVFTLDGKRMHWTYRSIEDGDKQFRACDMNEVARYYAASDEVTAFLAEYPLRQDFRKEAGRNRVFINIWCWEPAWKLRVTENGRELPCCASRPRIRSTRSRTTFRRRTARSIARTTRVGTRPTRFLSWRLRRRHDRSRSR